MNPVAKKSSDYIKRPKNAFFVFCEKERPQIENREQKTTMEVCKELGQRWRELTKEEKEPYVAEAARQKAIHKEMYPDYKYMPEKKKKKIPINTQQPSEQSSEAIYLDHGLMGEQQQQQQMPMYSPYQPAVGALQQSTPDPNVPKFRQRKRPLSNLLDSSSHPQVVQYQRSQQQMNMAHDQNMSIHNPDQAVLGNAPLYNQQQQNGGVGNTSNSLGMSSQMSVYNSGYGAGSQFALPPVSLPASKMTIQNENHNPFSYQNTFCYPNQQKQIRNPGMPVLADLQNCIFSTSSSGCVATLSPMSSGTQPMTSSVSEISNMSSDMDTSLSALAPTLLVSPTYPWNEALTSLLSNDYGKSKEPEQNKLPVGIIVPTLFDSANGLPTSSELPLVESSNELCSTVCISFEDMDTNQSLISSEPPCKKKPEEHLPISSECTVTNELSKSSKLPSDEICSTAFDSSESMDTIQSPMSAEPTRNETPEEQLPISFESNECTETHGSSTSSGVSIVELSSDSSESIDTNQTSTPSKLTRDETTEENLPISTNSSDCVEINTSSPSEIATSENNSEMKTSDTSADNKSIFIVSQESGDVLKMKCMASFQKLAKLMNKDASNSSKCTDANELPTSSKLDSMTSSSSESVSTSSDKDKNTFIFSKSMGDSLKLRCIQDMKFLIQKKNLKKKLPSSSN